MAGNHTKAGALNRMCYQWTNRNNGRSYYITYFWLNGKKRQRSFKTAVLAHEWLAEMHALHGEEHVSPPVHTEGFSYRVAWWDVHFSCISCKKEMVAVPKRRCKLYWDCDYSEDCLNMGCRGDWPGWAELAEANEFYKKHNRYVTKRGNYDQTGEAGEVSS